MSGTVAPSILHADLDAFYVSMELLRRPELRGTPVIVGYPGERGVVATCSYEARRFGVRSAMPSARALRLCPQATWLPPDWSHYGPASQQFHAILRDFTPLVESAGADEAYLDVHGCEALFGDGAAIATAIRARVRADVGIAVSIGVAANKLVAKVASDAAKPDGLLVVPAGTEAAFLAPRPLRELPMVGAKLAEMLTGLGCKTIGDVAAIPGRALEARFGKFGGELARRARGQYEAPVVAEGGGARSISRETTFGADVGEEGRLLGVLRSQADRVAASLAEEGRSARTVTLKLRFPPFETLTRSHSPGTPLSTADDLWRAGRALFLEAWESHGRRPIRLLGIGVTGMQERAQQLRLGEEASGRQLDEAIAAVRERFGAGALLRALELPAGGKQAIDAGRWE